MQTCPECNRILLRVEPTRTLREGWYCGHCEDYYDEEGSVYAIEENHHLTVEGHAREVPRALQS